MNRLQKKCLFAAAGTHLLVVVVLLCSGFIASKPKQDDTPVLTFLPDVASDKPTSGSKSDPTPPPTPVVKQQDPTPPPPIPPTPVVKQVEPVKTVEPVKPPEDVKPLDKPVVEIPKPKPPKRQIVVDLKPVVRDPKKVVDDTKAADAAAAEKAKQLEKQRRAFLTAMNNIKTKASTSTEFSLPGNSSASYANYGAIVVSAYHHAWMPPDNMATASAVIKFSVTIARDGTVMSSRITDSSGDSSVDRAVQRMLDRVTEIAPFPEDSKDQQRTYNIDFNATRTSML